ncbi:PAS domain-containing protein [Aneurinibacillus aneurinilyticus]|uniref:PAS domain-containing protein n=1 Tax=Aneurinibacillus aneurinilyticus TaxID=1391 RepID=UPI0035250BB8
MDNTLWESSYFPLFDSISLGIILLDHDERILHMNRFASQQLRFTSEEGTPLSLGDVFSFLSINQSGWIEDNFHFVYDVIYVSDAGGITLRVSSACEALWGYREEDLVGKSTYELEKEGGFYPSITRLVLERQEQVSMIQTTKTGRRLKVVGTPIKDKENRELERSNPILEKSIIQ